MRALSEDVVVPRQYGPLIERGMSLREIRKHNKFELWTMLMAINRYGIIMSGQGITADMRKKGGNAAMIYSKYVHEMDLFREQRGPVDGEDD